MKISSKLYLMTGVLVTLICVVGLIVLFSSATSGRELARAQQANALARSIAELTLLTDSYLAYQGVRIEEQWQSRSAGISATLAAAKGQLPDIDSLQLLFGALNEAFAVLRQIEQERAALPNDQQRLEILEERVAARMRMDSQKLLSQVFTIAEEAQRQAVAVQGKAARTIALLVVILSVAAMVATFLLIRSLTRRISRLVASAQTIRQGNPGERIQLSGQDEVAVLAREINAMVQALEDQRHRISESEKRFRTLTELAPDGIFLHQGGEIVYVNQAGLELLGATSAEQVVGRAVSEFYPPEDIAEVKHRIQLLETGAVNKLPLRERKLQRLDGSLVEVETIGASYNYLGQPAVQAFVRDITERRALLEINERSSRLAAIGTLAAGVAHEINNPNSVILYNLPLLSAIWEDLLPSLEERYRSHGDFLLGGVEFSVLRQEMTQLLTDCMTSSERVKRIVADLKNFAKEDRTDPQIDTVNLNDLVNTACRLVMNIIKNATDHFHLDLSPDLPQAKGDFLRLEQVLVNLLMNACQALTSKDQRIRVVTRYDRAQRQNLIEVHDQGRGISTQDMERILEPFFTTRRESGGTGLGLSISSSILKEHGGHVEISSIPGEGTCVKVVLPIDAKSSSA